MPRVSALLLSLALGAVAAVLVACGGSGNGLLPGTSAAAILANLDRVSEEAEQGNCETAADIAREIEDQIDALPQSVDPQLRVALQDGIDRVILLTQEPESCTGEMTTETTPTVTETVPPPTPPETTPTEPPPDGDGGGGGGGVGP
jgi:serine/threonine-protein kinase